MSDNQTTRKKFLQLLGLSAGTTLISSSVLGGIIDNETIHQLNEPQQEFMVRYGKWMDDFIEVIHIQKMDPTNSENNLRMISLTEKAEEFKPELAQHMQDGTFALIYKLAIQRMSEKIQG